MIPSRVPYKRVHTDFVFFPFDIFSIVFELQARIMDRQTNKRVDGQYSKFLLIGWPPYNLSNISYTVTLFIFQRLGSKQLFWSLCIFSVSVVRSVGWRSSKIAASSAGVGRDVITDCSGEFSRQEASQVTHGFHQLPAAAAGASVFPPQVPATSWPWRHSTTTRAQQCPGVSTSATYFSYFPTSRNPPGWEQSI